MNFALTDGQVLLREVARGSLSRFKTIEAAREALEDPAALPDLWPTAIEVGWPGLLVGEEHGGAGLGAFDALLVAEECGRVLAAVPLLGLLPASSVLDAARDQSLPAIAAGKLRPAYVPARPPGDRERAWTVEQRSGYRRAAAPHATVTGNEVVVDGTVAFVPDAPGADLLVVVGETDGGAPVAAAVGAGTDGVSVEPVMRYDPTRSLGRVAFADAHGRLLDVGAGVLSDAWYLAHALIAAESLGAVQTCLEVSVAYAKERFTFERAIGSYQAIKHELTEILRRLEERPRAPVLRRLGAGVEAGGIPIGGERRTVGRRKRPGLRRSSDDHCARWDRADLGARRAAVLPACPALAAAAGGGGMMRPTGWRGGR